MELPSGWIEAEIGDLLHGIAAGKNLKCEERPPQPHERGVIKVSAVTWGTFDASQSKTFPKTFEPAPDTAIKAGDFLFSRANTLELVGAVVLVKKDHPNLFLSDKVLRLDLPSELKPWLLIYLRSPEGRRKLGAVSSGNQMSMRNIGQSSLKSVSILLPPLNEQRRIVEKIEALFDEIDKGVESLQTARTNLGLYRQSLLKAAFEGRLTADWRAQNADKLEAPETLLARIQRERDARYKTALDGWQDALAQWRAAGEQGKKPAKPKRPDDVSTVYEGEAREIGGAPKDWAWVRPSLIAEPSPHAIGIGPFGSNLKVSDYREEGIPLVFVRNITQEDFSLSQKFVSAEKAAELDAHSIQAGDVLVTKMGDPPGDCTVYPDNGQYAIITADCLKFRVWDQFADRRFVSFMIRSNAVKRQLGLITQGVAQKKISVARFKTIALPLPSIAEQSEIVRILDEKLEAADVLEAEIDAALRRADALRQSILKKAFSGQLVPQDPADEPAAALLASIKAERARAPKKTRRKATA